MKRFLAIKPLLIKRDITFAAEWRSHADISTFCHNIGLHLKSADAQIMKDDPAATVAAVPFNGTKLVVKQYNFKNIYKFLSRAIRPSNAYKTWVNACHLSNIGIETVKPVALIEDRVGFFRIRSFFVGTFIPGQDARDFFHDKKKSSDQRCVAARRIVDSLQELHSRAIFVGDTKDTNVLIGSDKVYWVDLEELTYPSFKWLRNKKTLRDWQIFLYNWRENPEARQLFCKAVREKFHPKAYWEIIRHAALYRGKKFSIRQIQSRLNCAYYARDELLQEIQLLARGIIHPKWKQVGSSSKAIVAKKENTHGLLYCKVFLNRNKFEGFKKLFRLGRGARAVKNEQMMQAAGFLVPETLYWGKYKEREYIISKGVSGRTILSWLKQPRHDLSLKRKVLRGLGEEVAALHLVGFAHGDLRMGNILLEDHMGDFKFIFLDNERTKLFKKIPRKLIVQNLRQINTDAISILSRTDRLRIFRAYQDIHGRLKKEEEINLLAQIEQLTRKRLAASLK